MPLSIEIGRDLGGRTLERLVDVELPRARDATFEDLGIVLPDVHARVASDLGEREYRIAVAEVPVSRSELAPSEDDAAMLAAQLGVAARRHARELFGLSEAQSMLHQLESAYPALVRHVVPSPVTLPLLTDVLRRLVSEGVSIRPLREILEALALHAASERDPASLTELVRASLKRQITHRHTSGETLAVHVVDPELEEAVREAIQPGGAGAYLAMPPDLARELVAAVRKATGERDVVLLTQPDVRRFVRQLVEVELPEVPVLSYPELAPDVRVQTIGRIAL